MKNILLRGVMICGLITLGSCSVAVSGPYLVTDNTADKKGEASYSVLLGVFRDKDCDASIKKAAENGGITRVATVDKRIESKMFKTTYITVVTGN
ncbi:MAG: hypothetical protein ACI91R_002356 [Vicingaceae bacterium]|jgi:hypothetical protein